MKKLFFLSIPLWLMVKALAAQQFYFPKISADDSAGLAVHIPVLARQVLLEYQDKNDLKNSPNDLFRLQIAAGQYDKAIGTIEGLRKMSKEKNSGLLYLQYELYARAKLEKQVFKDVFSRLLEERIRQMDDKEALNVSTALVSRNGIGEYRSGLEKSLADLRDSLNMREAADLCKSHFIFEVFKHIEPVSIKLLKEDDNRRYIIEDSVMIKTAEGFTLSAVVVRKRGVKTPQPAALFFFMYANTVQSIYEAKQSASYGYVGVVADVRGKRLSPDAVAPYENEAKDVNAVIDWISRQTWSNGKVGMYGGSYSGFAQWAAAKHMHPALKTIVPYAAAIPGLGVPMENNVFINANYGWAFYVTNNKYLDNQVYNDPHRWNQMEDNWYSTGKAYNKIDSIDGTPNPWLQKWLKHPAFDQYWQSMIPYKEEYAQINIPVLSITGYYDDGQISAIQYLKEHYKYNPRANHYLIIGPYDHFGAQRGGSPVLRNYQVDPVALISTRDITYEWLDYILKGGTKPAILKDKINYEVMGANVWKHAATLDQLNNKAVSFYLTDIKSEDGFKLTSKRPVEQKALYQEVDFKDRKTSSNEYYPYPIVKEELDRSNGLFFVSEPLTDSVSISGTFSGTLRVSINKKDMDIGVVLYEIMPDGKYFCLSYYLGRASYAEDMSVRKLLTPGKIESIPFERTRMVSRQLSKGSRILVVLNINKNASAQINYGTGKEVSEETIADANEPLKIRWYNDSFIRIPLEVLKK